MLKWILSLYFLLLIPLTYAQWNDPYKQKSFNDNTLYTVFSSRPKHLDPARSYSSDEAIFTGQIYEPPLQYHYLKRPYQLEPLTLITMPKIVYKDKTGKILSDNAKLKDIATTTYILTLKKGIKYQQHPSFYQDNQQIHTNLHLTQNDLDKVYSINDFKNTGTRELVANDYIYQIKRLADSKNHSPIAGIMANLIIGFSQFSKEVKLWHKSHPDKYLNLNNIPISGVKLISKYRYRITIKGKYPQFLYWLAMPFFAPMPQEAEEFYAQAGMKDKNLILDWYPVGTGAYYLKENNPNKRMVLERNQNYHADFYPNDGEETDKELGLLADAGLKLPFIDKIVFSLEKESIPMWNKFLQGYYDRSGVSSDAFDQAVKFTKSGKLEVSPEISAHGINLTTTVQPSSFYWGFNMLDPTVGGNSLRAKKLRQAIAMVFDVDEFISIFMNGRGIIAQSPLPPNIYGNDGSLNPLIYDLNTEQKKTIKQAKILLAEAGYPNGIDKNTGKPLMLHLDTIASSGPDDKAKLSWLRAQFKKLSIQLNVRSTQYNRFRQKMRTGQAQIFSWGWNADYPDPENFLMLLYGPNAKVGKGGENAANYHNKEFDRLFEEMKNMENTPKRLKIINKMIKIVRDDSPWIWGFHPKSFTLSHAWNRASKSHAMANNTLKYARIDPVLRKEMRSSWNKPNIWPIIILVLVLFFFSIPVFISYYRKEHQPPKKLPFLDNHKQK